MLARVASVKHAERMPLWLSGPLQMRSLTTGSEQRCMSVHV